MRCHLLLRGRLIGLFVWLAVFPDDPFIVRYYVALLGGTVAPIDILPEPWQELARMLPMYGMLGFPAELAAGHRTGTAIGTGYLLQLGWIGVGVLSCIALWRRGVRRYTVVGLAASLSTVLIVFTKTDTLVGWTLPEALVLIGTFQLVFGVVVVGTSRLATLPSPLTIACWRIGLRRYTGATS